MRTELIEILQRYMGYKYSGSVEKCQELDKAADEIIEHFYNRDML